MQDVCPTHLNDANNGFWNEFVGKEWKGKMQISEN